MAKPIRWGIIGTGSIASELATAINSLPDAEIAAVGSRSMDTANVFADRFNIPHRHGNYADLAQNPNVDIVYIATPHVQHFENTMLCLYAGKAVLCEKPFTINAGEAELLIKTARERKLFLMEAMCTRAMPIIQEAKRLIAEGAIGEVKMMQGAFGMQTDFPADHRLLNPDLAGGVLLDIGVYPISMASYFLGPIVDVAATADIGATGVDCQISVSTRHTNGRIASSYASLYATSPLDAVIMGTTGRIHLHGPAFKGTGLTLIRDGMEPQETHLPWDGNGYQYELMDAMQCLRDGRLESSMMPLDETLSLIRTLDQVRNQIGLRYPGE
jgi:predicted dehydrogenase